MGFNRRKMEDRRRQAADKAVVGPTIGAAIAARYWFLWVRCPACRSTSSIDLRALDRHRDAAVASLILALSCRSCQPNAPFVELVRLSRTSIVDEMREEHRRGVLGEKPCRARSGAASNVYRAGVKMSARKIVTLSSSTI